MNPTLLFTTCLISAATAQPIINARALNSWAGAANSARADIVMLGDSNQLHSGFGYNGGYINALRTNPGIYATGLLWAGEGNGVGAGDSEGASTIAVGTTSPFSFSGAPAQADTFGHFITPMSQYLYLPAGSYSGARNMGMNLSTLLDVSAALRWRLTDVTFPEAGSYQCSVRLGQAPYSNIAIYPATSTGGSWGVRTQEFAIPAGSRSGAIELRYAPYSFSNTLNAPFLLLWNRCEQPDRRGVSIHTLYAWGGRSAWQMSTTMTQASPDMLSAYFAQVRALQTGSPRVLIRINQGLNDTVESQPSVGRGILPGNSPAAFVDNIDVTINRINEIWDLNQWSRSELTFALSVAHAIGPAGSPSQQTIDDYRTAATSLIATHPNLCVIGLSEIISHTEMISRGYYFTVGTTGPADYFHLSRLGYEQLSMLETQLLLNPPCPFDFNEDGGVDGADIETFFLAWQDGLPIADVNADGGVDGADIETFFLGWQSGC